MPSLNYIRFPTTERMKKCKDDLVYLHIYEPLLCKIECVHYRDCHKGIS